jgi:transporter family-2 protein
VQGAINARLRADLDAPITAALWSFVVATAAMAAVFAVFAARGRAPAPRAAALRSVPWWGWLGGLCGATYVTSVFLPIPHIGVSATVGLTVAGQQVASILVDRLWMDASAPTRRHPRAYRRRGRPARGRRAHPGRIAATCAGTRRR